eukprot:gene27346-biopygen9950
MKPRQGFERARQMIVSDELDGREHPPRDRSSTETVVVESDISLLNWILHSTLISTYFLVGRKHVVGRKRSGQLFRGF